MSCGPTAIANVLKWLGYRASHDKVVEFCKGIRTYVPFNHDEEPPGMWPWGIRYTFKKLKVKFKTRRSCTLSEIDEAIDRGQAVVLSFCTKSDSTHIAFIDARSQTGYRMWNRKHVAKSSPWCTRKVISDAIRRSMRQDGHCYVYYVSRQD